MRIIFNADTDVFFSDCAGEIGKILDTIKRNVIEGYEHGKIFDSNENYVGYWNFSRTEDELKTNNK